MQRCGGQYAKSFFGQNGLKRGTLGRSPRTIMMRPNMKQKAFESKVEQQTDSESDRTAPQLAMTVA